MNWKKIVLQWKIAQNSKTTPLTFTCSKSTIEKDVKYAQVIINFEHILHLFLGLLLLTSNKGMLAG